MDIFDRFRRRKQPDAKEEAKSSAASTLTLQTPMLRAMVEASTAEARQRQEGMQPFRVAQHPPKATPPKAKQMAMDSSLGWAGTEFAGGVLDAVAGEGLEFLGYPYLSLLAQRPEYRVFAETIATEATREWITFKGAGTSAKNKDERIKELTKEFERLRVQDCFKEIAIKDALFGRSHLFVDLGTDLDTSQRELATPIGGPDGPSKAKVKKGSLRKLKTIEPTWTYPTTYNATNPLKDDWYSPQVWYVMGTEVHATRLLTFIGHPVPDLLKPAYSFGGLSLSQMAKPYVDIWLQTRSSVGSLIHSFSVMVLSTDLSTILQPGSAAGLLERVNLFNALRDNQGAFVINKDSEDFKNVSASLAGLHELQAQSQEHMMSVARIPAVKFTGIQPTGLNASSEGEIRVFYDTIGAYQESFFRPHLTTVMQIAMLSLWGQIDEDITFDFEPLWSLSEKEMAETRKVEADTDQIYVDSGIVGQAEVRSRIAADPDGPYSSLDADALPDLLGEEETGLEPEGGRPELVASEIEEKKAA